MLQVAQHPASSCSMPEGEALSDQPLLAPFCLCILQNSPVTLEKEPLLANNPPQSFHAYPDCVYFLLLKDFELSLEEQHSKWLPAPCAPSLVHFWVLCTCSSWQC